jgi:hypothetical protein
MSMILYLKRISDADISRLMAAPAGVHAFIRVGRDAPDRGLEYAVALDELKAQMVASETVPPPLAEMTFETYPFNDLFDVDKMWHGLYFLLTGTAYEGVAPVSVLFEAPMVGEEDVGYGPARAMSAAQTRALSDYLERLDKVSVLSRLDGPRMKALDIYPDIWDENPARLQIGLGRAYDALLAYCRRCAAHELGMLVWIS